MDYTLVHSKYFSDVDFGYMVECIQGLEDGNPEGMFKFLVDDNFNLDLAMKIVAFHFYENKIAANDLITQDLLDDIHLHAVKLGVLVPMEIIEL